MKFYFLLLVAAVVSLTSAETDFSDENTSGMDETSVTPSDKQDSDEPNTTEMALRKAHSRQRNPTRFTPPNYRALPQHQPYNLRHSDFPEDAAIPHLGFPTPSQTIYLTDRTGHYDVTLRDLQQRQPTKFQAALGAISAHILNQRLHHDYIPYPPNADPPQPPALNPNYDDPPRPRPSTPLFLNQPHHYPNFLTRDPPHPALRDPPRPHAVHR